MYLEDLRGRLVAHLRTRLRNGELSERRLAHLTGISQPHIHNVLKGAKTLSPRAVDQILARLGMSLMDLTGGDDTRMGLQPVPCSRYVEVPVLDGWMGPGLPFPTAMSGLESIPLPNSLVGGLQCPVAARLSADPRMGSSFREGDIALLDRSRARRVQVDRSGLYVVSRDGEGLVRRLRLLSSQVLLLLGDPHRSEDQAESLSLAGKHLLDVIRARVSWIGRYLEGRPW